jgi:hypothetical protein
VAVARGEDVASNTRSAHEKFGNHLMKNFKSAHEEF